MIASPSISQSNSVTSSPATFVTNAFLSSYKTSTDSSFGPGCDVVFEVAIVVLVAFVVAGIVVVVVVIWVHLVTRG